VAGGEVCIRLCGETRNKSGTRSASVPQRGAIEKREQKQQRGKRERYLRDKRVRMKSAEDLRFHQKRLIKTTETYGGRLAGSMRGR